MTYFLADGQQRRGPYPLEHLLRHGLRANTLVWRSGMSDWRPAQDLPELLPLLHGSNGAPPPPPPPGPGYVHPGPMVPTLSASEVNTKKLAAGICGILLGGLGVHKFILGLTGPGLILLGLTVLSCGALAVVTSIVGIIEGIIYLTKTDAEFHQQYVVNRQGWF